MMAETAVMRLARRSRFSGAMSGIPLPTLASKRRSTPCSRARARRRGPCLAMICLLAGTATEDARRAERGGEETALLEEAAGDPAADGAGAEEGDLDGAGLSQGTG